MRSSCISHPADEEMLVIRKWQSDAFEDALTGALISYFIYWHDIKTEMKKQAEQANRVAEQHGDSPTQDTSLLQYHTLDEIEAGMLRVGKKTKIKGAIATLDEAHIISRHSNPNPKYSFDRTIYYLFHPPIVQAFLRARDLAKSEWSDLTDRKDAFVFTWDKYDSSSDKYDLPSVGNDQTITETSTEITSEITSENSPLIPQGGDEAIAVDVEVIQDSDPEARQTNLFPDESNNHSPVKNPDPGKDQSSAAPVDNFVLSKKPSKLTAADLEPFKTAWNHHKPEWFSECTTLNDKRVRALKAIVSAHGDRSMQVFIDALSYAAVNPWARDKSLAIDNVMTNGKVTEWAEKWVHRQTASSGSIRIDTNAPMADQAAALEAMITKGCGQSA